MGVIHKHIYDEYGLCFECDKEKPKMNGKQLRLLVARLIKSPKQQEAVIIYMTENVSAYEAEKRVFGKVTSSVSRDAKRVNEAYEFSVFLLGLQDGRG